MTTPLVKEGQIGLSWDLDKPQFLDKGWHWWLNCDHTFERVADLKEQYISHGPIHLIRVQKGKLGYALDTKSGSPMLLMAGTHYIRKAEFKWENFLDLSEPTLNLGALKMIRVDRGIVGYYFKEGELEILEPGLHVIAPPDKFGGFVSTQLQLLDLPKQVHESADYVQLEIDADVLYCIVNPKKALLRVRDLKRLIMKTALSTLAGIIRSSHLSEVAGSRKAAFTESMAKESDSKSFPAAASAPSFQQKVHDEFLSELHEYMLGDLGVEIVNIRINDLRIHEKNLASKISKESIKIAEQEAEHRLLQKEADIRTVRANNQALEIRIKAQADADEKLILVKAENDTAIAKARAQAQAIEIQSKARAEEVEIMAKSRKAAIVLEAQATAQKILLEAEAERKAKILRGEADKKYADMISTNEVGSRLATLEIQKDTLKGIEKVAFVPGLPSLLSSGAGALNIDVNAKDLIAGRSNK
mmetsp:Transcript_22793/g.40351  ORF Transcript_22793/g.40351 Transcript_22793/m.40351 type:complete len:473 (+) Transcript_22793:3-1421(+)|eukprot:CAMPEP_0197542730 /NCGR_PEP_ID=MMETSP1318-20131121/67861_1 /TAXON_ID=552666 /ORGANISM="Partenskyella glossopodia, Strain RCC365" /LENGTH=472 /DNA_ID=CAMNT_0043102015 /DNA_START=422 /DNA_END=1840 /DNA_ORIENTATION=-